METKTFLIVFPLAAGAVGNCFCLVGFLLFLLLSRSHGSLIPTCTHIHVLIVSLDVSMFQHVYQHIFNMYIHLCVVCVLWEYLTGLLPDLLVHMFMQPTSQPPTHSSIHVHLSIYSSGYSNILCHATVMSCFWIKEYLPIAAICLDNSKTL